MGWKKPFRLTSFSRFGGLHQRSEGVIYKVHERIKLFRSLIIGNKLCALIYSYKDRDTIAIYIEKPARTL